MIFKLIFCCCCCCTDIRNLYFKREQRSIRLTEIMFRNSRVKSTSRFGKNALNLLKHILISGDHTQRSSRFSRFHRTAKPNHTDRVLQNKPKHTPPRPIASNLHTPTLRLDRNTSPNAHATPNRRVPSNLSSRQIVLLQLNASTPIQISSPQSTTRCHSQRRVG